MVTLAAPFTMTLLLRRPLPKSTLTAACKVHSLITILSTDIYISLKWIFIGFTNYAGTNNILTTNQTVRELSEGMNKNLHTCGDRVKSQIWR